MSKRRSKKQITKVLDALAQGCRTSHEISSFTNLPICYCSARLYDLRQYGFIRIVDHVRFSPEGPPSHVYDFIKL